MFLTWILIAFKPRPWSFYNFLLVFSSRKKHYLVSAAIARSQIFSSNLFVLFSTSKDVWSGYIFQWEEQAVVLAKRGLWYCSCLCQLWISFFLLYAFLAHYSIWSLSLVNSIFCFHRPLVLSPYSCSRGAMWNVISEMYWSSLQFQCKNGMILGLVTVDFDVRLCCIEVVEST